jgi:hypothetical protein
MLLILWAGSVRDTATVMPPLKVWPRTGKHFIVIYALDGYLSHSRTHNISWFQKSDFAAHLTRDL